MKMVFGEDGRGYFKRFKVYWEIVYCPNCGKKRDWDASRSMKVIDVRYRDIELTETGRRITDELCVDCVKENFVFIPPLKRTLYGCQDGSVYPNRPQDIAMQNKHAKWTLKHIHRVHNRFCIFCGISFGSKRQLVCSKCNASLERQSKKYKTSDDGC